MTEDLHKTIAAWGVPEQIMMDGGSDYRPAQVRRICEALASVENSPPRSTSPSPDGGSTDAP